jgi:hypothetical protein
MALLTSCADTFAKLNHVKIPLTRNNIVVVFRAQKSFIIYPRLLIPKVSTISETSLENRELFAVMTYLSTSL